VGSHQEPRAGTSAGATVTRIEHALVQAFGRDRIETSTAEGSTNLRRRSLDGEPQLVVTVTAGREVSVLLDDFEFGDEWQLAIQALASPRLVDVHRGEGWVHCFVLDGPEGPALFTLRDDHDPSAAQTEGWLRSLDGWHDAS
jgi:hypothetical protein